MQLNNGLTKTQSGLTTQSVFSLTNENKIKLCIYNKNVCSSNGKITVSNYEFSRRLIKKIGKFIAEDFDWSNVLVAGGLISGIIDSNFDPKEYEQTDVDIFVYGLNSTKATKKIQEIHDYLIRRLDGHCYSFVYTPNTPIVNVIIPGECSFQIIGTLFKTKMEVLGSFDMTHCQIGYDETGIVYTPEFINAITTRVTAITTVSIHAYRLVKAYRRGYSIADPKLCYVKNIFHEYTAEPEDDKCAGCNTDKFYDIHNLQNIIDELEKNEIVQQNLTKNYIPPKHDFYTKEILDEEMKKIGELYAGKGRYIFTNSCDGNLFNSDLANLIKFVRMPFLC